MENKKEKIHCFNCKYFGTCKYASPEVEQCTYYDYKRKDIKYTNEGNN